MTPQASLTSTTSVLSSPQLLPGHLQTVSGCYALDQSCHARLPATITAANLRVDIDGWYPQRIISLTLNKRRGNTTQILARVESVKESAVVATVFKVFGGRSPFKSHIHLSFDDYNPSAPPSLTMQATTSPGSAFNLRFVRSTPYFHPLSIEYDHVARVKNSVSCAIASDKHAVHTLTMTDVLRATGFDVSVSHDHSVVPVQCAGADKTWDKQELHDAMQTYWAHFSDKPTWSFWILFANMYTKDASCAGLMFDDVTTTQRRGMAHFCNSMYFNVTRQTSNKHYKEQLRFFATCHEIGHLFNLAHSGTKRVGKTWLPIKNDPLALSFMNNPVQFTKGEQSFFADFAYRFTDEELLFLRHAPEAFVRMGGDAWEKNHALALSKAAPHHDLSLALRSGRERNSFSFLEPIVIECKFKNGSNHDISVDLPLQTMSEYLHLVIFDATRNKTALQRPFVRHDIPNARQTLKTNESVFTSLFIGADPTGWIITEPGKYAVVASLDIGGKRIVSNILTITVSPPASPHLEHFAQDYFSHEVARVLAFDGSNVLTAANSTLQHCLVPNMPVDLATHAAIALAIPKKQPAKLLRFDHHSENNPLLSTTTSSPDICKQLLENALLKDPHFAARTLGHIDFKQYVDEYTLWLTQHHQFEEAYVAQTVLLKTLVERGVTRKTVISAIKRKISHLKLREKVLF